MFWSTALVVHDGFERSTGRWSRIAPVSLLDRMLDAVKRWSCIAVCETCVRPREEVVSRGQFGDYSLCERCQRATTSADQAFWVRP